MSDIGIETVTRDAKEKWLLRPLHWAMNTGYMTACGVGTAWWDGKVDHQTLILIAILGLGGSAGLTLWGLKRISSVARGKY